MRFAEINLFSVYVADLGATDLSATPAEGSISTTTAGLITG
jgi:hypothetical protein